MYMESTEIIASVINNALPIVAASPVIVKLFDMVGKLVKTLYAPTLVFKNGKATVDVEMYKKKSELELMAGASFTLSEVVRLKNFLNSVHYASLHLSDTENTDIETDESLDIEMDFDWLMRFFDAVGYISSEELQQLWGRVLAGEVKKPRSCSLRTLDILRNMTSEEANIFLKLARLIVVSGDCYFIFSEGFNGDTTTSIECQKFIRNYGLNYSEHIRIMVDCGLLTTDSLDIATYFEEPVLALHNGKMVAFFMSETPHETPFVIESYSLTSSGTEIYKIIKREKAFIPDIEYMLLCLRHCRNTNEAITVTAHKGYMADEIDGKTHIETENLL